MQACSRTETAAGSEARAAAPTAAYWSRSSEPALTFHGSSSASRSSQDVPSSSKSPAFSAAAPTLPVSAAASSGAKNGRPVLVQVAPGPDRPNRALPAEAAGAALLAEAAGAALLAEAAGAALLAEAAGAALLAEAAGAAGAPFPERHTSSTAREPMCFSSHSTDSTPSAR